MNLRRLVSKQSLHHFNRLKHRKSSSHFVCSSYNASTIPNIKSSSPSVHGDPSVSDPSRYSFSRRQFHSSPALNSTSLASNLDSVHSGSEESDDTMNEFLSRFVYIMRGNLNAAYPECDKQTVDGMLLIIVEKVVSEMEKGTLGSMLSDSLSKATASKDFSDDLWKTVAEVSNKVCEDMDKERKKEQMKKFLQSETVKKMARFASEIGIRGDMLRELKFKWAREQMEESEFYESLRELKEEAETSGEQETVGEESENGGSISRAEEKEKIVGLPKRKGKINYKIYGLDLSDPKWKDVADKIHDAGEVMWPKLAKPITGKCKLVTEKILAMAEEEDPSPLLAEWVELHQPTRVDWESLLQRLQERNASLYFKVAEHVLNEPTFETNIRDFSRLIDAYAKKNQVEDAERILAKMDEMSIEPDILTLTILVHMYSKTGDTKRATQVFEALRNKGFKPDMQVYTSMIMAYTAAGEPKSGEMLMREMESRRFQPTEEIYMALLRAFAEQGNADSARRITTSIQLAGIQPSLESYTLLVQAYGLAGDVNQARINFDSIMKLGLKPDDKAVATMLAAYQRKNVFDKALDLLLQLEKQGFERGVATYTVLLDWLSELQMVDEAEKILNKIAVLGEAPPLKVHVSLCDMYSRAKNEKKALQALGVLEANKDQLAQADFERIIKALRIGGFAKDSKRMEELMESLGFVKSEPFQVFLSAHSR